MLSREPNPTTRNTILAFVAFFVRLFGGVILGILYGIFSSLMCKYGGRRSGPLPKTILVLVLGTMSYTNAMMFGWSGPMSILVCGFLQKK